MEKSELMSFFTVLDFYDNLSVLKEKERTGWIKWNITGRRESVNDHTTSAQHLAWALYSEYDIDVNIEHVIAMLSIHEIGESIIGDITAYDGVDSKSKAKREREAVVSICSNLKKGDILISLFDEFEAKETPEAKFAYLCDKLDFDLQARLYCNDNRCSIEKATYEMISIKQIQEIIENCAKTAWDVFWKADKPKFDGTYLESFFAMLKNA
ncbi:MAG: HD domain-containing protein [Clostridia bacterium]|nr:HD domain-containing protein [Clostridia bacterium]